MIWNVRVVLEYYLLSQEFDFTLKYISFINFASIFYSFFLLFKSIITQTFFSSYLKNLGTD